MKQATGSRPKLVILAEDGQPRPYNLDALKARTDVVIAPAADLPRAIKGADVLFLWDFFSSALRDAWPQAEELKWVHVAAAGVDAMMFDGLRESDVPLTNAHGTFDQPIAEFVLASILAHDKQLHRSKGLQRQAIWQHREPTRTAGSRALVVGTGGIGRATARLLRAVGMEVRGSGRTAREYDDDFGSVVPTAELAEHASWADHVVLIAPLTDQTRHMLNAEVLAAMKSTAHVVNVGRGALVDEPALIDALRSGRIAAASLDVFEQEPLPADHPFWQMENVHISAHMSGDVVGWRDALADQFLANLDRWLAGEPLANQVDKQRGYVSTTQ
ncbi:D-isomer specific 2-hydroxyacid dehydrogenase [Arthrobacter crystallopoietes BAB-32]|uniref:D-isomer specific 2-hydroxyacid dehydrogenase n=1 Tax=Arthrobacter crystallopoietes BAB-32 TaxID=1246476 RepID=N1UXD7_9MICC|nr:D-2-hydroxyacid dehydrogenase [Arthrobacter crystallopoietes]EMY35061.1 D-isomer specific 2-hydroxyacid dehydrogenase [Arthrobacter crystallopoietes BAB-32]